MCSGCKKINKTPCRNFILFNPPTPHEFSCLSPCSSWDTGLSFRKAAPVPQQYLSWAQGHQKQSLTVSRSRKHRPAQSLGGNYLLIASVSQKHHSNSSWDSRFIQQISTLGASFPSQLLNLEVVFPLLPPSPAPSPRAPVSPLQPPPSPPALPLCRIT